VITLSRVMRWRYLWPLRSTRAPAIFAAVALTFFGVMADRQSRQLANEQARAATLAQVTIVQAKLEAEINDDVALARGLVRVLGQEPDFSSARFAELTAGLVAERPQILEVMAAPNHAPEMDYPPGAKLTTAIGKSGGSVAHDLGQRAVDWLGTRIEGPVALARGGKGFIIILPVFAQNDGRATSIWGDVYAIIDADQLYRAAGVLDAKGIDIAISPVTRAGGEGDAFFGDEKIKRDNPVVADVRLPTSRWRIAAAPNGGWGATTATDWIRRLVMALGGILVVVPVGLIGHLLQERREKFVELRNREEDLERLSERLTLALEGSNVGVWEFDLVTERLLWDNRMNELYNYPVDGGARTYQHWEHRLDPASAVKAIRDFQSSIDSGSRYESQYKLQLPGGRSRVIRAIGKVYERPDSNTKIIGLNWDATADVELTDDLSRAKESAEARNIELEAARARIEYVSLHDSLTKLPNRMYLDRALDECAIQCAATGEGVAVLHIDLDRFKHINDTLGHVAGDAMLIHIAGVIRERLNDGDLVARTGGDEFVVLCRVKGGGLDSFAALAQTLIDCVRRPIPYRGHECRFGMSIGIAGAFGAEVDRTRLLVNADIALYRAKKNGGNRFEFFTEALQSQIISDKRLADSIMDGLERSEFIPYYQPQIDARTNELVGVEALARWRHPTRGVLAPAEFIQIAEDVGVVGAIDRAMLELSVEQFLRWKKNGIRVPHISVNVSLRRLQDERLLENLRNLEIEPGALSLELVESIYLDERDDRFADTVDKIKALGIDIEIDDFGTGYASIVSLTKLRPRRLKIDRQLVQPIVQAPAQRKLIRAIVDIAKSLEIEIVAEGVETMEHARLLRDLGCDILQGYAFAKPMAREEFEHFLSKRQRLKAV
jgi:diguanylate cyclase (GGDEF)-like protein